MAFHIEPELSVDSLAYDMDIRGHDAHLHSAVAALRICDCPHDGQVACRDRRVDNVAVLDELHCARVRLAYASEPRRVSAEVSGSRGRGAC